MTPRKTIDWLFRWLEQHPQATAGQLVKAYAAMVNSKAQRSDKPD